MSDMGLWWGGPLEIPQLSRRESQLSSSVSTQLPQPHPQPQQQQQVAETLLHGDESADEELLWSQPQHGVYQSFRSRSSPNLAC